MHFKCLVIIGEDLFFSFLAPPVSLEMGISQMWRLLLEVNQGGPQLIPMSQFKGRVVIVDLFAAGRMSDNGNFTLLLAIYRNFRRMALIALTTALTT